MDLDTPSEGIFYEYSKDRRAIDEYLSKLSNQELISAAKQYQEWARCEWFTGIERSVCYQVSKQFTAVAENRYEAMLLAYDAVCRELAKRFILNKLIDRA